MSHPLSHIWSSPRLIYRSANSPDTDSFFAALGNDALARTMASTKLPAPPTREQAFKIRDYYSSEALIGVVICLKPSNYDTPTSTRYSSSWEESEPLTMIGCIDLSDALGRHHRAADLGLNIIEGYRGQGYGTEAIEWILNWGFMHANLHRVHLTVSEYNYEAIKTYTKVGFKEEGAERDALWADGRWWKDVHMGILEEEWRESRKVVPGGMFLKEKGE